MTKPLVLSHAHCTDGYAAAFAAWCKFGEDADYVFLSYGEMQLEPGEVHDQTKNFHSGHRFHPKNLADRAVYVLDFSFNETTTEHLIVHAASFTWLDHHKTAFEMYCAEERELFQHDVTDENDKRLRHILLDNNKSGALLAWEHFHPEKDVPILIQCIDDRDRWQFKMALSKALHAGLQAEKPWTFDRWAKLVGDDGDEVYRVISRGQTLLREQERQVKSLAEKARGCHIQRCIHPEGADRYVIEWLVDAKGLAINTSVHMSEVGHALATASDTYGLIWYYDGESGMAKCSLRSNGDYDVSAIAKVFGGGGHKNASGFSIDMTTLLGWLK